jgi:Secretion system C-terminal sorting domain
MLRKKTISYIAMSLLALVLSACFTIILVTQPSSAMIGESISVKVDVVLDGTEANAKCGIVGIMLPNSWNVDSVFFVGDSISDYCIFLDPDSIDCNPGGQVDFWTDTLEGRYPSGPTMEWRVYQSSQSWVKNDPADWNVSLTIEMTVKPPEGNYNLSYFVSNAGLDFSDPTWWDISESNNINISGTIPVELTSFSGIVTQDGIQLNWATATETNNRGFGIERSTDGETYTKIGFISGIGTSSEVHNYAFVDKTNFEQNSVVSYRLQQVDFDGTYSYSDVINVVYDLPVDFSLGQNYPNPFNPSTMIVYSLPVNGDVSLKVYDNLGTEVAILVNETKVAGRYEVDFSAVNLPSGVYFYRLTVGNFVDTKKMLLLK